jgi:concanavalin A-like lectin/glucanase superfamily protein
MASVVHSGWAWRATNPNGVPSYAYHRLPSSYNEVSVEAWVYLASHQSSVKLFAVRPIGQRSLDIYVDQRNRVSVRNNIGSVTTYSKTTMANGGWHRMTLHAVIGDGTGSFEVSVDGVAVPGLSLSAQKLGFLPFGELRLGDTATAATFDIVLDDVVVSAGP